MQDFARKSPLMYMLTLVWPQGMVDKPLVMGQIHKVISSLDSSKCNILDDNELLRLGIIREEIE